MANLKLLTNAMYSSKTYNALVTNHERLLDFIRSQSSSSNLTLILESHVNATFAGLNNKFIASLPSTGLINIFGPLWTVIGLIGVVSNILVLIVLVRNGNKLVYEIFCIGLAITDLTFLTLGASVTILHYMFHNWIFGLFMCKFVNYVIYVALYSSAMMLLGLTSTRFMAVVFPWENRKMNIFEAKLACLGAWIIGLIFSIPIPIFMKLKSNHMVIMESRDFLNSSSQDSDLMPQRALVQLCVDSFPSVLARSIYQIFTTLMTYVIPFATIIVMNAMIVCKLRGERVPSKNSVREENIKRVRAKVTQLVIIVSMLYCICWLPTQVLNTWFNAFRSTFSYSIACLHMKAIAQTLSYASCCINPIVYSVMSGSFKEAIFKQFPRLSNALMRKRQSNIFSQSGMTMNNTTMTTRCKCGGSEVRAIDCTTPPHTPILAGRIPQVSEPLLEQHCNKKEANTSFSNNGVTVPSFLATKAIVAADGEPIITESCEVYPATSQTKLVQGTTAPFLGRELSHSSFSWSMEGKQESVDVTSYAVISSV